MAIQENVLKGTNGHLKRHNSIQALLKYPPLQRILEQMMGKGNIFPSNGAQIAIRLPSIDKDIELLWESNTKATNPNNIDMSPLEQVV